MKIKIYEDRRLLNEKENFGSQYENLATSLIFEFPEYVKKDEIKLATKDLNKTIIFKIEGDNELPIIDNKFSFPYDITKLGEVEWNVALKEKSETEDMTDKLIWYSETMVSKFGKTNEGHNEITIEKLDSFNVITTVLNEKIAEVEALKVDIGDYKKALDNKVDKEKGKGLSTNDFTNILKEKLENLENYNDAEIRNLIFEITNNLKNYYLKSETYNKEEIDSRVSSIPKFDIEVVEELPITNISESTVYLLKSGAEENNLYSEYIYTNSKWEKLGEEKIDISNLATKKEVFDLEEQFSTKIDKIEEKMTNNDSEFESETLNDEKFNIKGVAKRSMPMFPAGNATQIRREGYNLIDIENPIRYNNADITNVTPEAIEIQTIDYSTASMVFFEVNLKTGVTYSVSCFTEILEGSLSSGDNTGRVELFKESTWLKAIASLNKDTFITRGTFTVDEDGVYRIRYLVTGTALLTEMLKIKVSNFLLYEGTTQKPWEAYGETPSIEIESPIKVVKSSYVINHFNTNNFKSYKIDFPENFELVKIGNYSDYIYELNGIWYKHKEIEKAVFDGTENWIKSTSALNNMYVLPNGKFKYKIGEETNLYCNCFKGAIVWGRNVKGCELYTVRNIRFGLSLNTEIDTLEKWINFVKENNLIVYYILETSTDEKITDTNLINQLNDLKNAIAFFDENNITIENIGNLENQANLRLNLTYDKSNRLIIKELQSRLDLIEQQFLNKVVDELLAEGSL